MSLFIWTEHYKKLPCEIIYSLKTLHWPDKSFLVTAGVVPYWPPLLSAERVVKHVTGLMFMRQNHHLPKVRALQEEDYRVLRVFSPESLVRFIREVFTQLYVWCLKGKCPKPHELFAA
jgi:hypothetical protein